MSAENAAKRGSRGAAVLIGFAEALSAPEVAWSLIDAGFTVIAFTRRNRRCALRGSRFVSVHNLTAPEESISAATNDLERLFSEIGDTGIFFPLDDSSVHLSSKVKFPPGWVLAGPRSAALDLALDKRLQIRRAESAGLKVPRTIVAERKADLDGTTLEYPVIVRPALAVYESSDRLRKGRNSICATERELEKCLTAWREDYPLLVQPFIEGRGEGVFGILTEHGVEAWSAHQRLRMMNPHGSGSSACSSRLADSAVREPISAMLASSGWRGLFMMELLRDNRGDLWFVEFNGRPWGSIALARRQGLEYPAWHINLLLNNAITISSREYGRPVTCRNAGRELMHLFFVARGPKSSALKSWPSLRNTVRDLLTFTPTSFLYNWRRDDPRVFLLDCFYTVRDQIFKSKA